jgi:tRNA pseudouridine55 synthase
VTESGLLIIDKPGGLTSHDVVGRVRRAMGTRKVGHAGTLDPMATGVLVVGVNRATRLLGYLALHDKRYLATMRLGMATVTDDREGDALTMADPGAVRAISDAAIEEAVSRFRGRLEQRPSAVSAIKVDGRRAYDRVRAGEEVELAERSVEITSLQILSIARSEDSIDVDFDVECSTGTYVRALARDIGSRLGVGGHLTSLRRTRVGPFDSAISLDDLRPEVLISLGEVGRRCFDVWEVDDEQARAVRFGQRIPWQAGDYETVAVMDPHGDLVALAKDDEGSARYLAVLA